MNILITNFHTLDGGGQTTYAMHLAQCLRAAHRITIAAPATSKLNRMARRLDGVHVVDMDFPSNLLRDLGAIRRCARQAANLIERERYDLVHVNGSADHRLMLYARRLCRIKPPIVQTKHNSLPVKFGARFRARHCTDHVIAVSAYTQRQMLAAAGGHVPVTLIYNGIDIDYFSPYPPDRSRSLRATLPGAESGANLFVFTSVAGTSLHKGWPVLIRAVASLPAQLKADVRIVVCGQTPSAADFEAMVRSAGMEHQVIFPGMVDDVRDWIAMADAGFVLSTSVETISYACREMMAMGKPVLVSDFAGTRENLDDGVDGWVTLAGDVPSVADKVREILAQRDRVPAMGARARDKAQRTFGLPVFTEQTLAVYRQALGR